MTPKSPPPCPLRADGNRDVGGVTVLVVVNLDVASQPESGAERAPRAVVPHRSRFLMGVPLHRQGDRGS